MPRLPGRKGDGKASTRWAVLEEYGTALRCNEHPVSKWNRIIESAVY
jgi:hypothetical protein